MAIRLSNRFVSELENGVNVPNVVIELKLDGGTVRFGYHGRNVLPVVRFLADGSHGADGAVFAAGSDELPGVVPALKSVSSLQNKLDPKSGFSTRGQLSIVISGRENFRKLVSGEHLKNRRAVRRDGFLSPGFAWPDYAATFTGKILDWSRKGDDLTVVIADDLKDASAKIPEENASKTQYIDYRGMNPVDIMVDILLDRLGIPPAVVDLESFCLERDTWLAGCRFERVLTEPEEANQYLNELQVETNSFIVHDGEKISFKVFAPPAPWEDVEEWTDKTILGNSFSLKSGCRDNFYNRVVVYFDYDESGGEDEESFESVIIAVDPSSQAPAEWDEASTRVIKSRWMRSTAFTDTSNITGVKVYHVSRANGAGEGTLSFEISSMSLTWTAPGGLAGEPVKLSKEGRYQVFDADRNKYVRVIVTSQELPAGDSADTVLISRKEGEGQATAIASKLLNRYRDPVATASLDIDINNMAFQGLFIKPADLKDLTTEEACTLGYDGWEKNRLMLTSVRPDFSTHKVSVEAIETRMLRRYGFVAPPGLPDHPSATARQRAYGFVGGVGNSTGEEDGYYIW
ncbi:MAG TPA: hypothetical protein DDW94_05305 [Deltaproteobacteria bacterium]|nr:MAG: hypothetical protein A2Z79_04650 [Deltaproteobacteria bacterium GWA2_55_82]OIJ74665.1 MAG: hypothetical protein A2V21_310560 [Deltaproteobacteria bacterium GWC2_55_46]HBG46391.1 hypothetical protein [Deltaproteobacteria bacterium]HCY10602.1 hypothetical protein [Deltaproteobacteria bacterium]